MTDLIHVCEQAWGSAKPTAGTIHVTLTGTSLFSGRAALTKSEELNKLATALRERGVPGDAIALDGASIDVSTGLFTRSSSVTYRVAIRLVELDLLGSVLEVIANAKQATLSRIDWDYRGASRDELVTECARRGAAKARILAAALGVQLGSLHEVREDELGDTYEQPAVRCATLDSAAGSIRYRVGEKLAGIDLAPSKRVGVRVLLAYRVS